MTLTKIKEIFSEKSKKSDISIGGWVRAFRGNRFIELNDGSSQKNIQCVINSETTDAETLKNINVGSSIIITGKIVESIGSEQKIEIAVKKGKSENKKLVSKHIKNEIKYFMTEYYRSYFKIDEMWKEIKNLKEKLDGPVKQMGFKRLT